MAEKHPTIKFIAFGILCALCAAWLAQQTGNLRLFASTKTYHAVLEDVSGLVADDSVLLSGVRVGEVESIAIEKGKARVTFAVDEEVELRDSWEVGARWRNVTGQRYFYLYPVGDGEVLEPGETLPVEQSRSVADIGLFLERLTPLLRAINPEQQNKVVEALNTALDGKEERTQQLVKDLGSLTNTLADSDEELERVLVQGDALLSSYNERRDSIRAFLNDFADVSATLARRDEELLASLNDISDVQQELAGLIDRNDAHIHDVISQLETLTGIVVENREDFERSIATTRDGLAVYMLISRYGQWFNVRVVMASVQDNGQSIVCTLETGEPCQAEDNRASPGGDAQTSMAEPARRYSRAPARMDAATAVVGTALGDRPGAGLAFARDRMVSAADGGEAR